MKSVNYLQRYRPLVVKEDELYMHHSNHYTKKIYSNSFRLHLKLGGCQLLQYSYINTKTIWRDFVHLLLA